MPACLVRGDPEGMAEGRAERHLHDPRASHSPVTVASTVPGDSWVPTLRNHAGPKRAIRATWASVSTFWTRVGRPATPWSRTVRSRTNEGIPGLRPLTVLTAADSWPDRNRSGAVTTSKVQASMPRRARSARARSTSATLWAGTWTTTRLAPDRRGRHRGTVQDQMGGAVEEEAVLAAGRLAFGPVGHDHRLRPAARATARHLVPTGKPGPAVAAQPALVDGLEQTLRRDLRQELPHRARWASSPTTPPDPAPSRRRVGPVGALTGRSRPCRTRCRTVRRSAGRPGG